MKRNLDLIREILIQIEGSDKTVFTEEDFESLCPELAELQYNIYLICESGLVEAQDITCCGRGTMVPEYQMYYLTGLGCDYLDSVRNQSVWDKTKSSLKEVGGSASLDVVKTVASKVILGLLAPGLP